MRRAASWAISLAFLFLVVTPALAQERPAEVERLGDWVGNWDYTLGDGSGTMTFEWFGDYLIRADEVTPAGAHVFHMLRYNAQDGSYTWWRFWNNGLTDSATGWYTDGAWVFFFHDDLGNLRRMTMDWETPNDFAFKWERALQGGNWTVQAEGRTTRRR